jgi:hypothetical protein
MSRRLIIIVLATIFISSATSAGVTGFVLDRSWNNYVNQLTMEYENEQETGRKEQFARGYWRGMYTACLVILAGDVTTCIRGARAGYMAGHHLEPAPFGWDWFFVKYAGQMQ